MELINHISTDNRYVKDENGNWWYLNKGKKYKAIKRSCSSCGKIEIIRDTNVDKCKSCALTGIPKSEKHKLEIAKSNEGKGRGFYQEKYGYRFIMKKEHPNADKYGYVAEHRLVMEKLLERFLYHEEVVHHIDENKSNNHPNNLWLFDSKSSHMIFHNMMRIGSKKSNYIYLAGNISQNSATYKWRENIEGILKEERLYRKVVIVNPCSNSFNQGMKSMDGNGLEFIKEAKKRSQNLLRPKDYQLIRMCNLMIVDLVIGTDEKPLIGTIQELCWAKDIFKIPVIAITHNKSTPYTTHMWIDECCSAKVETVEEAANMVKTFFLEY